MRVGKWLQLHNLDVRRDWGLVSSGGGDPSAAMAQCSAWAVTAPSARSEAAGAAEAMEDPVVPAQAAAVPAAGEGPADGAAGSCKQ